MQIGTRADLAAVEAPVVDAFLGQRRRLAGTVAAFDDAAWDAPTRCAAWNAHEVVLHVVGATRASAGTIAGERAVFTPDFDPRRSPNAFVEQHASQARPDTVEALRRAIADADDAIAGARVARPPRRVRAIWGEDVDWRLFALHIFWDSWLHERDLLLPRGIRPPEDDDEVRLAAVYGLTTVAIMAGTFGEDVDLRLHLGGTGAGTFTVRGVGLDVTVDVGPLAAEPRGDTAAVADALSGRGRVADALDARPATIALLGAVGSFLAGSDAPGSSTEG